MLLDFLGVELGILLLFYGLIFFCIIVVHFRNRKIRRVREIYEQKLCNCLEPNEHLPSLDFPGIEDPFNQSILIDLIRELSAMVRGVEGRILLLIFRSNGLFRYTLQKSRYGSDYDRMQVLSVYFDVAVRRSTMREIGRFLKHPNHELRMITLLAWLNMEPDKLVQKLAGYPRKLSRRDYVNIYVLIQRHCIPASQASPLLSSANPSVVRFGQEWIRFNR